MQQTLPGCELGEMREMMAPGTQIRLYRDADWPQVWEIFREVVAAGETYAYDSAWTEDDAKAVWLERPPGACAVLHTPPVSTQPERSHS